jgi:OOP family OmpA-OmpF porin
MKKIISTVVFSVAALAMCLPAMAIELGPDATNVPSTFAKVSNGKVSYNSTTTAYCSDTFDSILGAYGLALSPEAVEGVPTSYAKAAMDKVMFNKNSIAYTPQQYHDIFTAYGLQLTPEDAATLMGAVTYCTVSNGKISFGTTSTAYDSKELSTILAAYSLPMVTEVVAVVETDCIDSDGDTVCDEIDVCVGTPKGVKVDERGCWTIEQSYLFDFDKSEVKQSFYPMLDHIAKVMKDNPNMTIHLEGHTDSVGTEKYNQGLSERRANAIKKALIERTMAEPARLKAVGYGEAKPIMTNETKEGRAKNRRVDLKPMW